jgi:hypothetical protein
MEEHAKVKADVVRKAPKKASSKQLRTPKARKKRSPR